MWLSDDTIALMSSSCSATGRVDSDPHRVLESRRCRGRSFAAMASYWSTSTPTASWITLPHARMAVTFRSCLAQATANSKAVPGAPFTAGKHPYGVAAPDLNGDGKPDLAIPDLKGDAVNLLFRDGTGQFRN